MVMTLNSPPGCPLRVENTRVGVTESDFEKVWLNRSQPLRVENTRVGVALNQPDISDYCKSIFYTPPCGTKKNARKLSFGRGGGMTDTFFSGRLAAVFLQGFPFFVRKTKFQTSHAGRLENVYFFYLLK